MAKLNSKSFLDNFSKDLIAANVIIPNMDPTEDSPYGMGYKVIDNPDLPDNFPQFGEDAFFLDKPRSGLPVKYKAVGSFGEFKTEQEKQDALNRESYSGYPDPAYAPRRAGMIRSYMDFVPGGIPASEGFNYDATLKTYPQQMQGVQRGNMPAYRSIDYSKIRK